MRFTRITPSEEEAARAGLDTRTRSFDACNTHMHNQQTNTAPAHHQVELDR